MSNKPKQDNSYWYSKITTAHECMRKYKLQHIDHVQTEFPASGDLEFGSAIHLALESYVNGRDGALTFEIYWDSIQEQKINYTRYDWSALKAIGEQLLAKFKAKHLKDFEPFLMEERLYGKIGEFDFEGTPDFVGKYRGVPSIVDFKTSAFNYLPQKAVVAEQLVGYHHLMKQSGRYNAEQVVYFILRKNLPVASIQKPVIHSLTDAYVCDMMETVEAMIATLDAKAKELEAGASEHTFPKNSRVCVTRWGRCPHFETCWKGKK